MDTDDVSSGIKQLVDHLRTNQSTNVSLGDIAGVTEVLLATMRRYFNSIDTTLYSEFRGLSEYIQRARSEISELRPNDLKEEKIPRAGLELEAIVTATEEATGSIMDAAEEIMSADPASENYGETVNDACMRIFEACSFQDITGQRITKVVSTLTYIEERLHGLQDAWGPDIADAEGEAPEIAGHEDARPDKDLLNGPALDGEGIKQDQVDDLLNGAVGDEIDGEINDGISDDEAAEEAAAAPENETAEPAAAEAEAGDETAIANGATANGAADAGVAEAGASQDDIDAILSGEAGDEGADAAPQTPESGPPAEQKPKAKTKKKAASSPEPELDDIVPLASNPEEIATQDDIDALFD